MRRGRATRLRLFLPLALLAASTAFSGQMISTPVRTMGAVMQTAGFSIRPAGVAPASSGDLAPQQLFEIARPGDQPVSIGRMFTSCACIVLEADSRSFGQGERVVLRLRNVIATPPAGQTYSIFVQLTSPAIATLRYDTYVQSSQFVPSPDGLQPTRGDIVADGVLAADDPADGIEIIVPKADNQVAVGRAERGAAIAARPASAPEPASAPKPAPESKPALPEKAGEAADSGDSLWREVAPRTRTKPVSE